MDTLTFISEIIKSITWQVFLIIIIFIFKDPLYQLIPFLRKLKYKDLEIEFGKEMTKLVEKAEKELPESRDIGIAHFREPGDINIALGFPRIAILESWLNLEKAAIEALKRRGKEFTASHFVSPSRIANLLLNAEILDKNKVEIFNKLRSLRNKAVHSPEFHLDPDAVAEFVRLTNILTKHIEKYT